MITLVNLFRKSFAKLGAEIYVLGPEDPIDSYKDKIDGFVIPGGRDIDPKFYNQEKTHARVDENTS